MTICPVRSLQPFFQLLHDVSVQRPNWRTDRPRPKSASQRYDQALGSRHPTRQPHNAPASAWKMTRFASVERNSDGCVDEMRMLAVAKCRVMAILRSEF